MSFKKQDSLKIEIETPSLLITAYPERDLVLFNSKYGAFSHAVSVDNFCDACDRAVAAKRKEGIKK